jgi:hypothetical protein
MNGSSVAGVKAGDPVRDLLSMLKPLRGNTRDTGIHNHDSANNRAGGITVSKSTYSRPKRFFIAVLVAGGAP